MGNTGLQAITLVLLGLTGVSLTGVVRADEDDPTEREYLLGINLEGKLSKSVGWSVEQAGYWDADHVLRTWAPQVGLSWKATDWLSLGTAVRVLREKDEDDVLWTRQRAMADVALALPADHWKLSYRLRWQGEWREVEDRGTPRRFYVRNRLQLKYAGWSLVTPYASVETYHRVDEGKKTTGVEKTRYTLGSEWALTKHQSLDLYGRRQVPFNDDPDSVLLGLEYTYSFK